MEVTGWPEQPEALAATVNGEPTDAPAAGLVTVIPEVEVAGAEDPDELDEPDDPDEPDALDEPDDPDDADDPDDPDDPDEPEEFDEPAFVEPGFVAALAALFAAGPPQPVPTIARTTSRESAIERCLSSFKEKILEKI